MLIDDKNQPMSAREFVQLSQNTVLSVWDILSMEAKTKEKTEK